jgi:hypothetical protein
MVLRFHPASPRVVCWIEAECYHTFVLRIQPTATPASDVVKGIIG